MYFYHLAYVVRLCNINHNVYLFLIMLTDWICDDIL